MVLADSPPFRSARFAGPEHTVRVMRELALGPRGEQSVLVRSLKDSIIRKLAPKDYLSEILALRYFAAERIRYSNDALGVEQVQDPERVVQQILEHGKAVGDCDDIACFIGALARQCGREVEFVVVGFRAAGDYTHVFARVREPRTQSWIVLDPVAGTDEARMLRRVTTWRSWRV